MIKIEKIEERANSVTGEVFSVITLTQPTMVRTNRGTTEVELKHYINSNKSIAELYELYPNGVEGKLISLPCAEYSYLSKRTGNVEKRSVMTYHLLEGETRDDAPKELDAAYVVARNGRALHEIESKPVEVVERASLEAEVETPVGVEDIED